MSTHGPAKKSDGLASTTPVGSRPSTNARGSEHPHTHRRPQGPKSS